MKKNYIRRTRAVSLINENRGRFFGITFSTNKGQPRVYNVQTHSNPIQDNHGYLRLRSRAGKYIKVDPANITGLSIASQVYRIRK